jgi:hypothetical protein
MKTLKIVIGIYISMLFLVSCAKDEVNPTENLMSEITDKSTLQQDREYLSKLLQEINLLAQNDKCSGSESFRYVGIGAKPCGGPSTYLAYNIDFTGTGTKEAKEKIFLAKVEFYNNESQRYLRKHFPDIVSDCAIPPAPKSIVCQDGKPVLIY